MRRDLIALLLLTLAGCASHAPAPVADGRSPTRIEGAVPGKPAAPAGKMYTVKKGDTLYSIAREQGVDTRDLSAWNNLDSNKRITIGQQLLCQRTGARRYFIRAGCRRHRRAADRHRRSRGCPLARQCA